MFRPNPCCLAIVAFALAGLATGRAHAQCAAGATGTYQYYAGNTSHQTGSAYGLDCRARPNIDAPGYLVYGPYDTRFGVGPHRASYYLQVNDIATTPKAVIASLQICTHQGRRILAQRDLSRRDFLAANTWKFFTLHFENPCFEEVETAIYQHGNAQFVFGQVYIIKD
ncbi:hypothetical protein [Lysobacter hankyongensis]|uniref:Uncharacterized protein n=1 Tax=Lysobacter hankyongensis TaxID=1176535 RepID=A0ABP9C5D7_9GAMM